jgi:predicted ester cyclase
MGCVGKACIHGRRPDEFARRDSPVMGIAPTNRRVQTTFWALHRFDEDGRIVETWNLIDSLAIMQQLGLVPSGS